MKWILESAIPGDHRDPDVMLLRRRTRGVEAPAWRTAIHLPRCFAKRSDSLGALLLAEGGWIEPETCVAAVAVFQNVLDHGAHAGEAEPLHRAVIGARDALV